MGNSCKELTGVTFILVRPDGKMLLQLRDEKLKYYPNTWCFPGEGREGDKEIAEIAKRGVREEFGVELPEDACVFIGVNHLPHISQDVGVVICKIEDNQIPELREGKAIRWMSVCELEKIKLGFEQNKFLLLVRKKLEEFAGVRRKSQWAPL
ncbi:MAG: NUDIX domain-containing protein [Candidatus Liptonbacteria bacterium]|nr:NUDIX domain-containing protein [Candidatus Liptonbacteria bacterium]